MSTPGDDAREAPPSGAMFPPTHWSLVREAGQPAEGFNPSLETLCRGYWQPLFTYLLRNGYSRHDAEDIVQGFLARVLAREDLAGVSPEKGRFRTFLLTSLRNYVIKHKLREKTLKRGGGVAVIPLDTEEAQRLCGPDLSAVSPEAAFDRSWVRTVVDKAFQRLRDEHRARDKEAWYEALAPFVGGAQPGEYAAVAARLGMAEGAVTVAVHRLRLRLRELVRAEVAQTVGSSADLEAEMKYLFDVWSK